MHLERLGVQGVGRVGVGEECQIYINNFTTLSSSLE